MFFITNGIDNYRKIFCYKGVASRKSYVFFMFFLILILFFLEAIDTFVDFVRQATDFLDIVLSKGKVVISAIILLSLFLTDISISVRRLHDIGLSGWFTLAPAVIIPAVQLIVFSWFEVGYNFELGVGVEISVGIWFGVIFVFHLLLALPKSKIENNKHRPADSISAPATNEAVS